MMEFLDLFFAQGDRLWAVQERCPGGHCYKGTLDALMEHQTEPLSTKLTFQEQSLVDLGVEKSETQADLLEASAEAQGG